MTIRAFPKGFLWGVATSAQQIEGGFAEGGRGESIWDRFAANPGRIEDGSDARVACDHYHRWREDVELMRALGVGAYRFSIAWPRVVPEGRGVINTIGLDFYDALVDRLLQNGIRPFVTLYHWDLPQALQDRGGWGLRDTADAFAEYAALVTTRLGDRVTSWVTHNEPWCIATLGHEEGHQAPGHRDPAEALRVAHHVLLSHGWASERIRQNVPGAEVGIVLNLVPVSPASPGKADNDAARRFDGFFNRWYLDPLFHGRYPDDAVADRARRGHLAGRDLPFVREGDLPAIATPLDFLGVNYYSRLVVQADADGEPVAVQMVPEEELTDMGWEVFPQGLHDLLLRVDREYKPPRIYITENGAAYTDDVDTAGRIADVRRVDYLRGHLLAAHRALADGVSLYGYFVWSLLDNFEWAHGYSKRFGLYAVDYATQHRTARDSAFWYRDVIAANAVDDAT
ncbi:MAG: GH1 family beta-glucosidase [Candidatus Krumholzibacteria bacterium]|nr:GH1 family beta-glucosidase [Candidatus Krumholzibacteria bacterium]